jgi:hypothetical protein
VVPVAGLIRGQLRMTEVTAHARLPLDRTVYFSLRS